MAQIAKVLIVAVALTCVFHLWPSTFVPPPAQRPTPVAAGVLGTLGSVTAVHADSIDTAAKELTASAYPLLKEVNWNSDIYALLPNAKPAEVNKAIQKALEMGAAMDPKALKAGVLAHSAAIKNVDADGVTRQADFEKINAALGHMIASAGTEKTMAVYDAFKPLVPAEVPAYLKGTVNGADAETAYNALMKFKDVVASSPTFAAATVAKRSTPDKIDVAAAKLSEASYPFLKAVNWEAGYYNKLPGAKPAAVLKAIDKALVQGAAMDSSYLNEGVLAHAKGIASVGGAGVVSQEDFTAINAAIGHMIASSGTAKTMDTFNAFKNVLPKDVPGYLMSTVGASDAQAAYNALLAFKDVVKAGP